MKERRKVEDRRGEGWIKIRVEEWGGGGGVKRRRGQSKEEEGVEGRGVD